MRSEPYLDGAFAQQDSARVLSFALHIRNDNREGALPLV